jgi:hypothetical protein
MNKQYNYINLDFTQARIEALKDWEIKTGKNASLIKTCWEDKYRTWLNGHKYKPIEYKGGICGKICIKCGLIQDISV